MKLEFLDIDGEGCHLVVNVLINGSIARMILDTGASRTVINASSVNKFKGYNLPSETSLKSIGIEGISSSHREALFDLIELDDVKLENPILATLDMTHVNNAYKERGFDPVDGLLGGDILRVAKATIDYFVGDVSFL